MSKRRLKFSKLNMAKYISHLDLLRCFTRSIMRSGLPVKYSQGFNPHQKITFSLPLSIGVTGSSEFVDIDFEDTVSDNEILSKLNEALPPDIRILSVGNPEKNAADIVSAKYTVTLISDTVISEASVKAFFNETEITVMKKTKKKGEQPANLMEFIKSAEVGECTENNGKHILNLDMVLAAGGKSNLKPEIAIMALIDYLDTEIEAYDIHRDCIYMCKNGVICEFD